MATYKFENFKGEIINPIIEKVSTSFTLGDEKVKVYATLNSQGNLFGVELGEMDNTPNWTDVDVMAWAENKLQEYKV